MMIDSEPPIFQGLPLVAFEAAFAEERLLSDPGEGPAAVTPPDRLEQS
jgi:hypothetical protein